MLGDTACSPDGGLRPQICSDWSAFSEQQRAGLRCTPSCPRAGQPHCADTTQATLLRQGVMPAFQRPPAGSVTISAGSSMQCSEALEVGGGALLGALDGGRLGVADHLKVQACEEGVAHDLLAPALRAAPLGRVLGQQLQDEVLRAGQAALSSRDTPVQATCGMAAT